MVKEFSLKISIVNVIVTTFSIEANHKNLSPMENLKEISLCLNE
jgi:hypothetical protein